MKTFSVSCALLLGTFATAVTALAGPSQLSGFQTEDVVTITNRPEVTLKADYTVPAGKKIVFEAGAQLKAERGAKIVIAGEMTITGDEKSPVFFRGRGWDGVVINETGSATISGLQMTGASIALEVNGRLKTLKDSVFAKNDAGVLFQGTGKSEVDNVLFTQNKEYGLMISGQTALIKNCSFVKNKGVGAKMNQSSPVFERTLFSDNNPGLFAMETSTSGKQCHFDDKGIAFQSSVSHGSLKFPECYWGAKSTGLLKSKGTDTKLPNVKDANNGGGSIKVYVKDFLSEPPKPCGATVTSKL